MRIRYSVAATLGALALVVALPTSANAANGEFIYTYLDGSPQSASLDDPPNGECITIPEVADPSSSDPAYSPKNKTNAIANVFANPDCTALVRTLLPGFSAGAGVKFRSVKFRL